MLFAACTSDRTCPAFAGARPSSLCVYPDAGRALRAAVVGPNTLDMSCAVHADGGELHLAGAGTSCPYSDTGGVAVSSMRCDLSSLPDGRYTTMLEHGAAPIAIELVVPLTPDAGIATCP
ncbi:MAG: hypothetical protein JNK82_36870 [Myxococcaceae bacterium]|nr:hypothetical protein [Myxococcaceae bacterium]